MGEVCSKVNWLRGKGKETITKEIYEAVVKGSLARVKSLTQRRRAQPGFHIDWLEDEKGRKLLHVACEHAQLAVVHWLMKRKANLEARDRQKGYTPLHFACENGNLSTVKLLLDSKADVNASNEDGYTSLYTACENGNLSTAKLLLDSSADVNAADELGYTPLHFACADGNLPT
ncbi:hypothetical protein AAMO2058_000850200, partial [Amorphochlora amoebiformis]